MQHQIGNGSISYWMCKSLLENKFNSVTKTTLLPFQFPFQNIFSTLLQVDIPWIMCHLVWNKIAGSALTIYFTQFYILLICACIKEKFFWPLDLGSSLQLHSATSSVLFHWRKNYIGITVLTSNTYTVYVSKVRIFQ